MGLGCFLEQGISRVKLVVLKNANKWRDFSVDTAKQGIDVAKYGYEKYQEARNPVQLKLKKMFGFGDMEVEDGMLSIADIKKSYNKNVKNTKLRKALKETAENGLGQVYDKGTNMIENTRHLGGVADALKKSKKGNISKLTQLSRYN